MRCSANTNSITSPCGMPPPVTHVSCREALRTVVQSPSDFSQPSKDVDELCKLPAELSIRRNNRDAVGPTFGHQTCIASGEQRIDCSRSSEAEESRCHGLHPTLFASQRPFILPDTAALITSGSGDALQPIFGPCDTTRRTEIIRRHVIPGGVSAMSTTSPATLLQPPSVEAVIKRRNPLRNVHKEVARLQSPRWSAGTLDHNPCRLDGVFPNHSWMDGLLVGLECAGPSGVAVRSADGLCVLAVHFQRNSDLANAADHGRPKPAEPPRGSACRE